MGTTCLVLSMLATQLIASEPTGSEFAGFKLDEFPAVGEPTRVELVRAGEGERRELRYQLSAGSRHEMAMRMHMSSPGGPAMPVVMSAVVIDVLDADAERARIEFTMPKPPELAETEGVSSEIIEALGEDLRGMSSFHGRYIVTNRGIVEGGELEIEVDDPTLAQLQQSMHQSMRQMSVPFPAEPVGVGAEWQTLQMLAGETTLYQVIAFELLSLDGPMLTLGMTVEQFSPQQDMPLPPETHAGVRGELVSLEGSGTGEMIVDLRSPVPRSRMSVATDTKMRAYVGEEVQEFSIRMETVVEVEPGESERNGRLNRGREWTQ